MITPSTFLFTVRFRVLEPGNTLTEVSLLSSGNPGKGPLARGILDPEAEVLVRKLSQLNPLSKAKRAKVFKMLCGISCELAGCVHRPIVDSESR